MTDLSAWHNREVLRVAARTVAAYESELVRFVAWGGSARSTSADLDRYLAERKAAGLGASGLGVAVCALRSYFRFVQSGAAAHLRLPPVAKRLQRTLSDEEALRALSALDSSSVVGKRDLALLAVMLASGLRASEVCALRIVDLDLSRRVLRVVVKGGAERFGVFDSYTSNLLSAWLAVRPACEAGTVFVTLPAGRGGGRGKGRVGPMSRQTVRLVCKRIAARAGLAHFSPHALRRTFATLATAAGCPSRVLQAAGRWSSLEMVERYTQALDPRVFDPYSPLVRLLGGNE